LAKSEGEATHDGGMDGVRRAGGETPPTDRPKPRKVEKSKI